MKGTKMYRWTSSVKSRGLDSKELEWLELFFLSYQQNHLMRASDKQEIKPVGD